MRGGGRETETDSEGEGERGREGGGEGQTDRQRNRQKAGKVRSRYPCIRLGSLPTCKPQNKVIKYSSHGRAQLTCSTDHTKQRKALVRGASLKVSYI